MPENEGAEHHHFEYLHFDPDDAETGFSNMVDLSYSRFSAQGLAAKLIADPKVWALHIRRYPQPEQDVHLYDETQHLAKAQNIAYRERKRADTLQKLLGAAVESNHKLETERQHVERRDDVTIEALNAVIETLMGMLHPDAKVNIKALRESEWRKAKLKSRAHVGEKPQSAPELCVCGHPRERHVDEGPEYGCHDCARDEYDHAFKAPEPESADMALPEDECSCGHPRKDHNEYACRICVVDHTHAFKLAVL
jgi:hypothetical protein